MEGLNTENWPLWLVVSMFLLLMIYRDIIKPYFEKKIQNKLEIEKKNLEIKKYNEESERWSKLLKYIEKNAINIISIQQAENIITETLQNASRELILKIYDYIQKNDVKNPFRQKIIASHLMIFVKEQKAKIIRILGVLQCNNKSLGSYFEEISNEHTMKFIDDIKNILFSEMDDYRKKDDLVLLITSHYNQHINEAIEKLK